LGCLISLYLVSNPIPFSISEKILEFRSRGISENAYCLPDVRKNQKNQGDGLSSLKYA
jgi:hypothetical protein